MKKFLALILSLVCVFALAFTACGEQSGDNTDDTNNEQPGDNQGNENNEQPGDNEDNENNDQPHEHTYETTWSYDSQTHWHAATCHPEEKKNESAHTYVDGKCVVCNRAELYGVGDQFPDFVVDTLAGGTFSSESARGKVLVINFWYVNCGPCVDEMPEIEQVKNAYGDKVEIIALHATSKNYKNDLAAAPTFVTSKGWNDYSMLFGKDNEDDYLFNRVMGANDHPVTVIINGEGVITFIKNGTIFPYIGWTLDKEDLLTPAIEAALGN